jgi:hypothetical protein
MPGMFDDMQPVATEQGMFDDMQPEITGGMFDDMMAEDRPSLLRRFDIGLSNIATGILHGLGKSDDPALLKAYEIQQERKAKRKERFKIEGGRPYPKSLLEDELTDIARQLRLRPEARGDADLKQIPDTYIEAPNPFRQFDLPQAEGAGEYITDTLAGITGFVAQMAALRQILPNAPTESLWEVQNIVSGGKPGRGAALGGILKGISKAPAVTLGEKATRIGVSGALFGGLAYAEGGDAVEVAVSTTIGAGFAALHLHKQTKQTSKVIKAWREKMPWMRNIPDKTLRKTISVMQESQKLDQIKNPDVRFARQQAAAVKYQPILQEFEKAVKKHFPTGRGPAPTTAVQPAQVTSLGFPEKYQPITPVKGAERPVTPTALQKPVGGKVEGKLAAKKGFSYRAIDRADEAVGKDVSVGRETVEWFEGDPFLLEIQGKPGKTIAHHPGAARGEVKAEDVKTIYYLPEAIIDEAQVDYFGEQSGSELSKLKTQFPNAQVIPLKIVDGPEGIEYHALTPAKAEVAPEPVGAVPGAVTVGETGAPVKDYPTTIKATKGPLTKYEVSQLRELGHKVKQIGKWSPARARQRLVTHHKDSVKKHRRLLVKLKHNRMKPGRDGGTNWAQQQAIDNILSGYTALPPKMLNTIKRSAEYTGRQNRYNRGKIPLRLIRKFNATGENVQSIHDMTPAEINALNDQIKEQLKLSKAKSRLIEERKIREAKEFLDYANDKVRVPEKAEPVVPDILTDIQQRRFKERLGAPPSRTKQVISVFLGHLNDDFYTTAGRTWGRDNQLDLGMMQGRRGQLDATMRYYSEKGQLLYRIINNPELNPTGKTYPEVIESWTNKARQLRHPVLRKVIPGTADVYKIKIGGKNCLFTMGELISFTLHTRADYNNEKVVKYGVSDSKYNKIADKNSPLTEKEYNELLSIVENDPMAKAFTEGYAQIAIQQANEMNAVSRKLDGYNIAEEDNWFHIEYWKSGGVRGKQYVPDRIMDEDGRAIPRTSANRPVVIRDIFEVMAADDAAIANLIGLSKEIRKYRMLLGDEKFRDRVRGSNSPFLLADLDEHIGRVQREGYEEAKEVITGLMLGAQRNAVKAALTSPKIMALQRFSKYLMFTETDVGYYSQGYKGITREDMEINWTLLKARTRGIGSSKSLASPNMIRKQFLSGKTLGEAQLAPLHWNDLHGVRKAGKVTSAEMADPALLQGGGKAARWWQAYGADPATLEPGSEEYWQAFNDRADYVATRTQPMFFAENKSRLTGTTNDWQRSFVLFRGFVDQIGRITRRTGVDVRDKKISKGEAAANIGINYSVYIVIGALAAAITDIVLFGKDKRSTAGKAMRRLITGIPAYMPVIGYPISRILESYLNEDWDPYSATVTNPASMLLDRFIRHSTLLADNIGKDTRTAKKNVRKAFVGLVGDMLILEFGIPAHIIERIPPVKKVIEGGGDSGESPPP